MKNYGYSVTVNNPKDEDNLLSYSASPPPFGWSEHEDSQFYHKKSAYEKWPILKEHKIDYLLIGKEVAKTGTKHLQIVVVFNTPKSLSQIKKIWPRAHVEYLKGTLNEATNYITNNREKPNPNYRRAYIGKLEDIERRLSMDKQYLKVIQDSQGTLTDLSNRTEKMEKCMEEILQLLKEKSSS